VYGTISDFKVMINESSQITPIPIITLDGPSGAGKGTLSKLLADKLGWHYLDSGAIYRVLALAAIKKKIPDDNVALLVVAAKELDLQFIIVGGSSQKIVLAGEDITLAIREESCGKLASKISAIPDVRAQLIATQHSFCRPPGLIADGRDMGTTVFPGATFKFFLTATSEERAKRRLRQLQEQGINASLDQVLKDMIARDERDSKRAISPTKPDPAAVIIDTTRLSIDEVLQQIFGAYENMQF
jgi:CMP/dCMP kinase